MGYSTAMNELLNRDNIRIKPLRERKNKVNIERDHVEISAYSVNLSPEAEASLAKAACDVKRARKAGAPVMLAFGAHSIKNGLAPVFISLIEKGWVTHLATNGAGIIHDWEFAFQGQSSEDVRANVAEGQFGIWEETGFYINLSFLVGAYRGLGYGESVGAMVEEDGIKIPTEEELSAAIAKGQAKGAGYPEGQKAAAALDLLSAMRKFSIESGFMEIKHTYKSFGLQAAAFRAGVPFTGHPMFGHDIIYTHPLNTGAAIGRTAERDFLAFAKSVSNLEGGVYLSVGSAVMSPMIFEKSLSMARNLAFQEGKRIENFSIYVVDLSPLTWDWSRGTEPPQDNPGYYLRFLKTFNRMGGRMTYVSADNRDFLVGLSRALED
jgi:hypothetical protein